MSKDKASVTTVDVFKQNVDHFLVISALHAVEKVQKSRLLSEAPINKISRSVLIRDVRFY